MKWCRLEAEGGGAYGIIEGDTVNIKHGDVFEIEIPGIGALRTPW